MPTRFATSGGQATQLAVFHHRLADPIDAGVVTNSLVEGIDQNNLEPLVPCVLSHPIRVQDTEASQLAACSLLRDTAQVTLALVLVDTLVARLAIHDSLRCTNFSITSLDADSVDDIPLLGFVPNPPSLVGPCGLRAPMDGRKLAELPISHPSEKPENIALLLTPK